VHDIKSSSGAKATMWTPLLQTIEFVGINIGIDCWISNIAMKFQQSIGLGLPSVLGANADLHLLNRQLD
jgi:hypothetical protein